MKTFWPIAILGTIIATFGLTSLNAPQEEQIKPLIVKFGDKEFAISGMLVIEDLSVVDPNDPNDPLPPPTPELTGTASTDSIRLEWNQVDYFCFIQLRVDDAADWDLLATLDPDVSSFLHEDLMPGVYHYRAQYKDPETGLISEFAYAEPQTIEEPAQPPTKPQLTKTILADSIKIEWDEAGYETEIQSRVGNAPAWSPLVVLDPGVLSFTHENLVPDTYYYRARYKDVNNGLTSEYVYSGPQVVEEPMPTPGGIAIDAAWLNNPANGNGNSQPWQLVSDKYYLAKDVEAQRTAFQCLGTTVELDLNGFNITYDMQAPPNWTDYNLNTLTNWEIPAGWTMETANQDTFAQGKVFPKDGTHYLQVLMPAGNDKEAACKNTVRLTANEQYVLQGHITYSTKCKGTPTFGWEIVDTQGNTFKASATGAPGFPISWRGMQLFQTIFVAPTTSEYTVRAFVKNASLETGTVYFSYPRITHNARHGIVAGCSSNMETLPDIKTAANLDNFVLRNSRGTSVISPGNRTVGQTSYRSHGVTGEAKHGVLIEGSGDKNDSLVFNQFGAMSRCLQFSNSSARTEMTVRNGCQFSLRSDGILSRDNWQGSAVSVPSGNSKAEYTKHRIHNCRLTGSQHMGFVLGKGLFYDNYVSFDSWYTNDFAAVISGPCKVYQNVLDFEGKNGRGIMIVGGGPGDFAEIYENTLKMNCLSQNSEYGGYPLGGSYGVQVEGGPQVLIRDNVGTLLGPGALVRTNPDQQNGQTIEIRDNEWFVDWKQDHIGPSLWGLVYKFNAGNYVLSVHDDIVETNHSLVELVGTWANDMVLKNIQATKKFSTWKTPFPYVGYYMSTSRLKTVTVDVDQATTTWLDDMFREYHTGKPILDSNGNFKSQTNKIAFPRSVITLMKDGQPLVNAATTIADARGNVVFNGLTNAVGEVVLSDVVEYGYANAQKQSYNPYSVQVTGVGTKTTSLTRAAPDVTVVY